MSSFNSHIAIIRRIWPLLPVFVALPVLAQIDSRELQVPPAEFPRPIVQLRSLSTNDRTELTKTDWKEKRGSLKKQWQSFLGKVPRKRTSMKGRLLESEELSEFTRQHVEYQIEKGVFTDGYLLTPKNRPGKLPAVVVFHQTTTSQARQPAGLDQSKPELMHGVQLVKRGYIVLCPRSFIFQGPSYTSCVQKMQSLHPSWLGMTRMMFDGIRAVDYLESLPNVDKARIGGLGHSLGAKEVLYAAAFDERYKAVVFSEGGIGLTFSNWDAVWYLGEGVRKPGFNLEHHQLLSLIAPRAFLLLAGNSADSDASWAFIEAAIPIYKLLGAAANIGWFNHGLGHRYPPNAQAIAETFLDGHLKSVVPTQQAF